MNLDLQKRWATRWEGRRPVAYDDATGEDISPATPPEGNPTIGVGCNLRTAGAHIAITGMGLNFPDVISGRRALTDDQIDYLLGLGINTAIGGARRLFPALDSYPENAQLIIIDLCFNMGAAKLATFTHTCASIRAGNWPEAAAQLQDSAWFHQVGSGPHQRGGANVAVLAGRVTPEEVLSQN